MKKMICPNVMSVSTLAGSIVKALCLSATLLGSSAIVTHPDPAQAQTEEIRFYCGNSYNAKTGSKVPTTIVWTSSRKTALVQWIKPMGNYWTPERRCNEFSQKINTAYQNQTLSFLTNGKMNGQKVICTAVEFNGDCKDVLMTLRPQDNALLLLSELKDKFNGRGDGSPPIAHSSGEPQIYYKIDLNRSINTGSNLQ
jgi:hypothetical protein